MQWRKQTLYRENQRITAFSHDTVKTSKVLSCFCYSCVFFILIHIFSVSFDLLLFFFSLFTFSTFQSQWSSGFMKNAVFMCLSPSAMLPASVTTFTDVSSCLCPSLHVVNLSLCPYHFHQSVPYFASVWLHLSVSFSCRWLESVIYHVANFVLQHFPNIAGTDGAFTAEALPTQRFYMATKQCNTQAK